MATIREIAKTAGVSRTTVWGALRGDQRVADGTKDRILRLAKEMGYRPNPAFQQMCRQIRQKRKVEYQSTIALINHFDHPHPEKHDPFHRRFLEGTHEEAKRQGFRVDHFWTKQPDLSGQRLSDIMRARGIEGLIVAAGNVFESLDLVWDRFATIAVGFTLENPRLNRVDADYQQAMRLCIGNLMELGHRRIGLVLRSEYETWRRYNLSVPYYWYQATCTPRDHPPVLVVDQTMKSDFLRWMKTHKFDGLITNHFATIDWCQEAGIRVPEDLGVALSTPTPIQRFSDISGIDYHPSQMAAAAVNVLVAQMHRNELGYPRTPKIVTTRVSWKPGKSTFRRGPSLTGFLEGFPQSSADP
jgi:LacI family transcriptional regulator